MTPLRVLIAPQELKGSLTAVAAAEAIAAGVRRAAPTALVDGVPLADGGPGTVEALVTAAGGQRLTALSHDPLGRPIVAAYGLIDAGSTAVVEMAAASGLVRLAPPERNALVAGSEGTGELIRAALDHGVQHLIVGLGGSATNDGGVGMARALGVRFLDEEGTELPPGGAALARLARVDMSRRDPRLNRVTVTGATDVRNPLCGPDGASAIFGPQKGATPADVATLDAALAHYAAVLQRDLGVSVAGIAGAGAAGGLGAGLVAFLGAELRSGFALVAEAVALARRLAVADLVLTGEGRLDGQSGFGKTVAGVAALAAAAQVPCVALCGGLEDGWQALLGQGLTAAFSIAGGPASLDELQRGATERLAQTAEQVTRLFLASRR